MSLTGEEIRRNLAAFADRWRDYRGTERAEAQTFLNELLECYGTSRSKVARFEEPTGDGFIDLIWPRVCIVEMKRPSQSGRLAEHRGQALEYWRDSGTPQAPAPRYVVLCAFQTFEVWEPGAVYREPRATFTLDELPERLDALLFLAGREPVFVGGQEEVTRYAVDLVTQLYTQLRERRAAEPEVLRDFLLQCVWSMFAEDLQMLPAHMFTRILDGLFEDPRRSSADDLAGLFRHLAEPGSRPDHGLYAGVPYANGGLFARPASVHLEPDEVAVLRAASREFDWKRVEPSIFGSLLQGALGRERQWALGAHYTAEADILEIVRPTIVDPWRERIAACRTLADVEAAQHDLMHYVVLDPACGSGNFLYVAYRELRRIEAELRRRATDMRRSAGLRDQQTLAIYFPLSNMKGIEIDPFAVQLARVTLWMGHKLAVNELDLDESVLPLADLSGIQRADALSVEWPRADAIIGNPPYHGTKFLRGELGDDYVEWLRREFGVGVKDFAVYWFRKAEATLSPAGRAGFVATNSIREGGNRSASLGFIEQDGGIVTHAVSSKDWSGEANVYVSIVNWVKQPAAEPPTFVLDGQTVQGISSTLRAGSDAGLGLPLGANLGRQFFGVVPGGAGFILSPAEARDLLSRNLVYDEVVRPFLVGADITNLPDQTPARFIIDFYFNALEDAMRYPDALDRIR
ncbi:MAG: DNA methyltransferase, partial [Gaiellaceae bacterium]